MMPLVRTSLTKARLLLGYYVALGVHQEHSTGALMLLNTPYDNLDE